MEKMYEDFVNVVLPYVQEGMVISYEYFIDLFGRYVKFLIIIDSLGVILWFIVVALSFYTARKLFYYFREKDKLDEPPFIIPAALLAVLTAAGALMFFEKATDLAKALTVPEIRVYEEIQSIRNRAGGDPL